MSAEASAASKMEDLVKRSMERRLVVFYRQTRVNTCAQGFYDKQEWGRCISHSLMSFHDEPEPSPAGRCESLIWAAQAAIRSGDDAWAIDILQDARQLFDNDELPTFYATSPFPYQARQVKELLECLQQDTTSKQERLQSAGVLLPLARATFPETSATAGERTTEIPQKRKAGDVVLPSEKAKRLPVKRDDSGVDFEET